MKRIALCALFIINCSLLTAQNRSRLAVYVPEPTGGTEEQREFFQSYFKMELIGANYPSVDTREESMYTLNLGIENRPEFEPSLPPGGDNDRYKLNILLVRTADGSEVVSFSFPFSSLDAMSNWTLYLLYNALANAYIPEDEQAPQDPSNAVLVDAPPPAPDDRWRNKWLYASLGGGLDGGYLIKTQDERIGIAGGMVQPALRLGAEVHFLNFLSVEIPLRLGLIGDGERWIFELGPGALLKGVIKFTDFIMLEPYAGAEYDIPLDDAQDRRLSVLGGLQLGLRGGKAGAITVDFSAAYSLADQARTADGGSASLLRFTLLAGYKYGFFDRKKSGK